LFQVRILCFLGQLSRAETIARQSGDRTACYHLARHYENIGKSQTAIQFYKIAQTYSNAVRICKENDLQNELWDVANSAGARDKASAAAYFEEVGAWKQAVELYHRAGMLHKAVEMAFASKQPETLQVIAAELDTSSDPELVERCAEFFLGIEQPHKAVNLLANTRQFEKALTIAEEKGVPITETLAEMLTPTKDDLANDVRVKILRQLGEILQEQGDYHAATKKFTQAGDKIRAMKSLLKSGDTDKVIYFAGMSRQKEIYVMAGNYLQALNWQSDAKIMKSIVTFYSKGQAHDLLANFYANCAQVEIEEYHDYDKALKAMQEAARCLAKLPAAQRNLENLQLIIGEMKAVLDLFEAAERKEYQGVIATAKQMLNAPERPPIRHADILAVLVESLIATNQFSDAVVSLKELAKKAPDWTQQELIDRRSIERLAYESGVDFNTLWSRPRVVESIDNQSDNDDDDEDEIQEEVEM
jgi:intraflagellar transport protein 140